MQQLEQRLGLEQLALARDLMAGRVTTILLILLVYRLHDILVQLHKLDLSFPSAYKTPMQIV